MAAACPDRPGVSQFQKPPRMTDLPVPALLRVHRRPMECREDVGLRHTLQIFITWNLLVAETVAVVTLKRTLIGNEPSLHDLNHHVDLLDWHGSEISPVVLPRQVFAGVFFHRVL